MRERRQPVNGSADVRLPADGFETGLVRDPRRGVIRPPEMGHSPELCAAWTRRVRRAGLIVTAVLAACGNRPDPPAAQKKDAAPADAAVVELDARPLGM